MINLKYIYKIVNNVNGKIYIGQSKNPERRFLQHANPNKDNSLLTVAINKYGISNFSLEILGYYEDYNEKEKYFIKFFNSLVPNGYNILPGGEKPPVRLGENNSNASISDEVAKLIQQDLLDYSILRKDIAKKYNVGTDLIRHINNGTCRRNEEYTYPLRPQEKELNKQRAAQIINLLQNTNLSQKEIADKIGWSRSAVTMINIGANHRQPNIEYPIRK